ncbi:MAG: S24 family peptidase, partial [Rhodospirillales bacterium]|nr:S24 family peptidase [Rhodospirillales bacterium]
IVVDISRRVPVTGEMVVLWDGGGLVVKRVEMLARSEPPAIRLLSANPAYEPYTCLIDEAHIVGKVIWTIRKA